MKAVKAPTTHAATLLATLLAAAPLTLPAAVLEYEPFDYPDAAGSGLNGLNGGTGWGGNAFTDGDALPTIAATTTSLAYPTGVPLTPAGGRIATTADATNNPAYRLLGTTMSLAEDGGVFYSSALFRSSAVAGELASVLFDRDSSTIRWYYGIDNTGRFSVAVDPSNTAQRAYSTTTTVANTTYLLVAMLRNNTGPGGNDEVFLKIFQEGSPIVEPATDAAWDLTAHGNSGVVLNRVRLSFTNAAGQSNEFDELRIGTTFADVTGIPEPATAALVAGAALALARRRRRG